MPTSLTDWKADKSVSNARFNIAASAVLSSGGNDNRIMNINTNIGTSAGLSAAIDDDYDDNDTDDRMPELEDF